MNDAMSGSKGIDWARYFELVNLRDAGQVEEAILELTKLGEKTQDRVGRALAFLEVANGLRTLRRVSDARHKIRQACELLGAQHEFYPRAALQAAVLDLDEGNAKGALRKLDAILKNHMPVLQMEQHKDLLEEAQRNRGIALAELRRFHEARTILEPFRSEPYERERNLYYLGACAYELGDFSAARRDFEEMLNLEAPPTFRAYAHEYLGRIFYDSGQIARAKIVFEECLAFSVRDRNRDEILLKWLISLSKELNQTEDTARYSEMLRKLPLT
jgi:tetratricopeptide (TPR) repeat protein